MEEDQSGPGTPLHRSALLAERRKAFRMPAFAEGISGCAGAASADNTTMAVVRHFIDECIIRCGGLQISVDQQGPCRRCRAFARSRKRRELPCLPNVKLVQR